MRFANGKQNSKLLFYIDLYLQVGTFNAMVARSNRARPTTYLDVKSRGYL